MEHSHAYLRLPKILVNKKEVYNLIDKYDKIEINKQINKGLVNINVTKVIPYLYIKFDDLATIIGCANKHSDLNIPILSGIASSKSNPMISHKTVRKLMEIEKKHSINLAISKDIISKLS